ncbi:MAG: thiamine pyrophosphate-dependent enzyme [Gemmatimonadota bacterium]
MPEAKLLLGNEAIARGLVEAGCAVATSYPGTPASEILSAVARWKAEAGVPMHVAWSVNEKVAFETAYAASIAGLRAAVSMKQVGLNVALDPFFSAAYTGVRGGLVVVSADDPGPHSSQTEQDSRRMAAAAKVPVLDPVSPRDARELVGRAFALSERFGIPVMLRPTTRVCHASQDVPLGRVRPPDRLADFRKEPGRWAATPVHRSRLHRELVEKLSGIAAHRPTAPRRVDPGGRRPLAVVASGVAFAHAAEVLEETGLLATLAFYRVVQPYPLHPAFVDRVLADHAEILVLEETTGVIESQFRDRGKVRGKESGAVPEAGELLPETIERIVARFAGRRRRAARAGKEVPGRRPTLCPGCPHRASFMAIRKAAPKGIYPGDIGCYTLGTNLGAVDTVLCMGASIGQAAGFHHAYRQGGRAVDIVATIGDSTFFHAGVPPLVDAVVQGARITVVILDNRTTAMTGNQPTPQSGFGALGEPTAAVDIEALVRGCGVTYCRVGRPTRFPEFLALMREAVAHARENGPAVVIARDPCVVDRAPFEKRPAPRAMTVSDACDGCRYCVNRFECPALVYDAGENRVHHDVLLCSGCGVCAHVCPRKAIGEAPRA